MKRVLSSQAGLFSIVTLAWLAAAAACSSSSGGGGGTVTPPGDDGGESGSSSGGATSSSSSGGVSSSSSSGGASTSSSSSGGTISTTGCSDAGGSVGTNDFVTISPTGGDCPVQCSITLGVHITFPVTWPASTASNQGTGNVDIWLMSNQSGNTMFTGTARTCGTTLPVLALNGTGAAAVCAPGMTCPTNVQIAFNDAEWDTKIMRTFSLTGTQTGWNPGDTLTTNPSLGVLGLNATAGSATATWPPYCASNCYPATVPSSGTLCTGGTCTGPDGAYSGSEITDDDGDGFPGITANPLNNSMFSYPPTSVTLFGIPPLADQVYIVTRNQIALSGMRMSSCTQGSGSATISLFDNHVVGCHATAYTPVGGSQMPAAPCTSAQVSFLDQNRTIYGPNATSVASTSSPITGTVTIQQMAPGATCADVRAITN